MKMPRPEYPRPQFVRRDWQCLNGDWQFEFDHGDSGRDRGLCDRPLKQRIVVPFCPESKLSGHGHTDYLNAVWYRRQVRLPAAWRGRQVQLHFGAVDYDATVWVNGTEVARHRGGFTPFTCDLTGVAAPGELATIVVRARDPHQPTKPGGKQSNHRFDNAGCHYTRTTGIWQTVWLDPVPAVHLRRPRLTPDLANGAFHLELPLSQNAPGHRVRATLSAGRTRVATAEVAADADRAPRLVLGIPRAHRRPWSPAAPFLYDLKLELLDGADRVVDQVVSYAGLRAIAIDGNRVLLNGQPVFQRLVLDQGYYPDGILTAPTDAALRRDIELSLAAGFNGARLHQKVFEERFLYHADRLGYLVWGEFGDWGLDRQVGTAGIVAQWLEALERDYSHPAIVGWCPLNETAETMPDSIVGLDDVTVALYLATKALDLTRPVLDASGYSHRVRDLDIYDCHDYEQDPQQLRAHHAGLANGQAFENGTEPQAGQRWSYAYRGQPYFVSEFGGIKWAPRRANDYQQSWGYGEMPRDRDEFHTRFAGQCAALLDNPAMFGYCYTQLTDVFQEQNGIFAFDRQAKFDLKRLRAAQQRPAACELAPRPRQR